jgi:hypothetical protein
MEVARLGYPMRTERNGRKKRFGLRAPEDLMSKYLNDLIKSLQSEAKEHQAALKDHTARTGRAFRRDTGYLGRLLQRIKSLEELQMSEAKRHRQIMRGAVANSRRRVSSRHVSHSQGNARPQ